MPLSTQRIHLLQNRLNVFMLLMVASTLMVGCSTAFSKTPAKEISTSEEALTPEKLSTPDKNIALESGAEHEAIATIPPQTDTSKPTEENTSAPDDTPLAQAPTEDTIEPATLETTTTQGLKQGMPYGEVRQRLIDQGWIPHTIETSGPAPKLDPWLGEKQMLELGFNEVVDCSGTGRGYCRFEFVFQDRAAEDGAILAVTTYASSDIANPEPFFAGLSVRRDHIDITHKQQDLNAEIFQQIQEQERFEWPFGIDGVAHYAFADSVLLARSYEFGNTITLFPKQPLSKQAALDYARILDPAQRINWETYSTGLEEDVELYFPEGYVTGSGPVTTVTLQYTMTGEVSKIRYTQPFI